MIRLLFGVFGIFLIVAVAELLWRKRILKSEWSRKFVHMGVASFVAFWPFFTSFRAVQVLSLSFLAVIALSRWLHVFRGIHSVKRKTLGELFYPLGIGLAALLTTDKYIFAAAVLNLGLADGLASIIGLTYGRKHQYHIGKLTKSYLGTFTFCLISAAITFWVLYSPAGFSPTAWPILIVLPLFTALVENIAPYGSDNLFIPLSVVGLLGLIPFVF